LDGELHAFARINMTSLQVGLAASAMGLGMLLTSTADAQQSNRQQRAYRDPPPSGGVTVWPKYTPREYVVCWNGCDNSGAIVMGADPDPFIRSQIVREGARFFGDGGK
jgi:hypothetical protein